MADDAALSECLDAGGPAGRPDAPRPGVPRLLALSGRPLGRRRPGGDRPCAGPTCGLPERSCRANRHWRNAVCSPPSFASMRAAASIYERSWALMTATPRRAHVGGGRTAARGRTRGRPSLRRPADFRQEREPVARPADAARRNPRVPHADQGVGHRSGRLARELPDQPRDHQPGAAAAIDRGHGRRDRPRRGAGSAGRRPAPGLLHAGQRSRRPDADRGRRCWNCCAPDAAARR